MDDFGLTFTPTAANAERGQSNGAASDNVQEAIRTLSLRIPKVGGAQGFSPLAGTGSGMTGTPQMGLEQLLARLFGQQGMQQGQQSFGGFGGSNQPAPSFVPGVVKDGSTPIPGTPAPVDPEPAPRPLAQPLPAQTWSERLPPKFEGPRSNFS